MKLRLDSNFCELLSAFDAHEAQYLIIGGWAVSVHAQPRATLDLDLFVSDARKNLESVYESLVQFGAPLRDIKKDMFLEPGTFFRMGMAPRQIDIFSAIPGVRFDQCWSNRQRILLDPLTGFAANVISASDLIAAKLASGRAQDLADVEAIRRAQAKSGS